MSRVQFVESIALPLGYGGALTPVQNVSATPFTVDEAGVEGIEAIAYANRVGSTLATTLISDVNGSISFWLDYGDYNIHFEDQQIPPRVAPWVQGFEGANINMDELILAAQNLIQFTGDVKMSYQTSDHGLSDGIYGWLLIAGDGSGNPRRVSQADYMNLWTVLGEPTVDGGGLFALPNISGRAPIGAGASSGLTTRSLGASGGEETHELVLSETPSHNHGGTTGTGTTGTGTTGTGTASGTTAATNTGGESVTHTHGVPTVTLGEVTVNITLGPTPAGFAVSAPYTSGFPASTTGESVTHTHPIPALPVSVPIPGLTVPGLTVPGLTIPSAGSDGVHNNMSPYLPMNFFIKS